MGRTPGHAPIEILGLLELRGAFRGVDREQALLLEHEGEQILGLGVLRPRVVARHARRRRAEQLLGLRILAVLGKTRRKGHVRRGIAGVELEGLLVVRHGIDETVVELVKTKPGEIGLFGARIVLGLLWIRDLGRQRIVRILGDGRVGKEDLARGVRNCRGELLVPRVRGDLHGLAPRLIRIDGNPLLGEDRGRLALAQNLHRAVLQHARGVEANEKLILLRESVDVDRAVDGDVLDAADALHGEPELLHRARLVGVDPAVVGLIVAPAAHHQLKVGAVGVGEDGVPHVRLREVAPEEELLADGDVAIRDVGGAHVLLVVEAGDPSVLRIHREDGATLDREVAPPGEINHPLHVIRILGALGGNPAVVNLFRPHRERGPEVLVVVEAEMAARREEHLIVVATVDGDIGPVDHRLDVRAAVHEDVLGLEHRAVRQEGESDGPLQTAAKLGLADPDGLLARLLVFHELPVDWHCGRRAVVMREVPLHTTRNPCAEHADERRLHDVLAVEGFEAGLLVREVEEMSAMLGEETELQPVVLHREVLVDLVDLAVVQHVLHRVRIDAPLRALVDAARVEHGGLVVTARRVRRQHDRRLLHLHATRENCGHRERHSRETTLLHVNLSPHFSIVKTQSALLRHGRRAWPPKGGLRREARSEAGRVPHPRRREASRSRPRPCRRGTSS